MIYNDKNKLEIKHIKLEKKINSYGLRCNIWWVNDTITDVEFDETKLTSKQLTDLQDYLTINFPNLKLKI